MFCSLPKTIQDAVLVTLGLGIHYLWVDAMCIIQDDEADKSHQISQMQTIYRCSTVTIAASTAASCTEGFLHNRQAYRLTKIAARLSGNAFQDVSPTQFYAKSYGMEGSLPLFQRGWTFQETHLSRRMLSYTHEGMVYRCLEAEEFDGLSRRNNSEGLGPGLPEKRMHPNSWCKVVRQFTSRQLALPLDKLPAIAGMAKEYSRHYAVTKYHAGLWREKILAQLLWYPRDDLEVTRRTPQYVAPSWSWACLIGTIKIASDPNRGENQEWPDISDAYQTGTDDIWFRCCTVLDVQSTVKDLRNPFGMITDGSLRLSATVRPIICRY